MRVILTGITGNLGFELSLCLLGHRIEIIPCIRPDRKIPIPNQERKFKEIIESDLLSNEIEYGGTANCIIHCAGVVHFQKSGNQNEIMMQKIITLARKLAIPVHFISTAFVHKPDGITDFNNAYELDKYNAEQLLINSGLPHDIFRPSVLMGHSITGAIKNFSGYYHIVEAFLTSANKARSRNRPMRFPKMPGVSNVVPIDQAAKDICEAIASGQLKNAYVTNPKPPSSNWLFDETINFFNLSNNVRILDIGFDDFGTLELTDEEARFYRFSKHFYPYWSKKYIFPSTICRENLVSHNYLVKVLTFFQEHRKTP